MPKQMTLAALHTRLTKLKSAFTSRDLEKKETKDSYDEAVKNIEYAIKHP